MTDKPQAAAPGGQRIQIQLDDNVSEGHYSNLAIINHSPAEFVLDFARVVPGSPKAKVQTRVLLAPIHAKNLLKALETNIKKYEENVGEIKMPGKDEQNKGFGFQI